MPIARDSFCSGNGVRSRTHIYSGSSKIFNIWGYCGATAVCAIFGTLRTYERYNGTTQVLFGRNMPEQIGAGVFIIVYRHEQSIYIQLSINVHVLRTFATCGVLRI